MLVAETITNGAMKVEIGNIASRTKIKYKCLTSQAVCKLLHHLASRMSSPFLTDMCMRLFAWEVSAEYNNKLERKLSFENHPRVYITLSLRAIWFIHLKGSGLYHYPLHGYSLLWNTTVKVLNLGSNILGQDVSTQHHYNVNIPGAVWYRNLSCIHYSRSNYIITPPDIVVLNLPVS